MLTPPSLSSLQTASQLTPLVRRPNASILCLLPNIVSPTACSQDQPNPVALNCSWILCLKHQRKWRSFWQPSTDSATGLDGISSSVPKTCSCTSSIPLFSVICLRLFYICLEIRNHCTTLKRCKNRTHKQQTDLLTSNHQRGHGIHHRS